MPTLFKSRSVGNGLRAFGVFAIEMARHNWGTTRKWRNLRKQLKAEGLVQVAPGAPSFQ
jgi:hypothetical protein